jgi:hypothetical protein
LCCRNSLQHLLDLAFGLRELLCIAGAQHHIVFTHSSRMASARGSPPIGTPNAFATQSVVMSPWVGPIPPVVKT